MFDTVQFIPCCKEALLPQKSLCDMGPNDMRIDIFQHGVFLKIDMRQEDIIGACEI